MGKVIKGFGVSSGNKGFCFISDQALEVSRTKPDSDPTNLPL